MRKNSPSVHRFVSRPTRVAFVCTGNICRSPMGEVVMRHDVESDENLRGGVAVSSAGTALWPVGAAMDRRAPGGLDRAGFSGPGTLGAYANGEHRNLAGCDRRE